MVKYFKALVTSLHDIFLLLVFIVPTLYSLMNTYAEKERNLNCKYYIYGQQRNHLRKHIEITYAKNGKYAVLGMSLMPT